MLRTYFFGGEGRSYSFGVLKPPSKSLSCERGRNEREHLRYDASKLNFEVVLFLLRTEIADSEEDLIGIM